MADATTGMFVRYRQTESRLQVSLIETRRIDGKVRHEHIASLGSVGVPPSVEDRLAFWQRLHERLAKLSNRLDATGQAKVLGDINARIPMVTLAEQQALKLANAKAEERFWDSIASLHAGTVEGHKGLAMTVERKIAVGQDEMAKAAAQRDAAKERRERLERGDDVSGGLNRPMTWSDTERILRDAGWSKSNIQNSIEMARLSDVEVEAMMQEVIAAMERADKAATRAVLRRKATP
jgi:hypothetical protein